MSILHGDSSFFEVAMINNPIKPNIGW